MNYVERQSKLEQIADNLRRTIEPEILLIDGKIIRFGKLKIADNGGNGFSVWRRIPETDTGWRRVDGSDDIYEVTSMAQKAWCFDCQRAQFKR